MQWRFQVITFGHLFLRNRNFLVRRFLFSTDHQTLLLTHLSKWLQIAVAYLSHASFILQRFLFALLVLGCFFPTQFGGQSTIWLHIFPACTVSSNLIPTHNNRLDIWQWQLPGLGPHFFLFFGGAHRALIVTFVFPVCIEASNLTMTIIWQVTSSMCYQVPEKTKCMHYKTGKGHVNHHCHKLLFRLCVQFKFHWTLVCLYDLNCAII